MADTPLAEEAVWEESIRQIETTDTVIGGEAGVPNIAPRQLANRTQYLKAQMENHSDEEITPDPHPQYPLRTELNEAIAGIDLSSKADAEHTHETSDINGLDDQLSKICNKIVSVTLQNADAVTIDSNELNITDGNFIYPKGKDGQGFILSFNTITEAILATGAGTGEKWVGRYEDGTYRFDANKPSIGSYTRKSTDDDRLIFDTDTGKWYESDITELITGGSFDTDTTGWTLESGTTSIESGRLRLRGDGTNTGILYQVIDTVVGKKYKLTVDTQNESADGPFGAVRVGSTVIGSDLGATDIRSGDNGLYSNEITFTATSDVTYITLVTSHTSTTGYGTYYDNVSILKIDAEIGNEVSQPVSYLPYSITFDNDVPQSINDSDLLSKISGNAIADLSATELINLNQNVKIVDFGLVYTNSRYIEENPFCDENYLNCVTKIQISEDNTTWFTVGQSSSYGLISEANEDGIVIQTASTYLANVNPAAHGLATMTPSSTLTSVYCRVIVFYIGEAQYA